MTDRGSILVVDNEPESLVSLTNVFTAGGYEVRPVDSGQLALESAMAKPPHLILLDICMPGMGGFEVCRRLKASDKTRDIPLIFISATRDVDQRIEGLRLGAVDFVNKLFQPEELLARVRTHLELSRLRADLEKQVEQRTAELRAANARLQSELAERLLVVQALRESEERFRNLANTAPVGIWATGPDQLASFFNKTALAFLGRSMEELRRGRWTERVHPDDVDRVYSTYVSAVEARSRFRIEYRMRRADNQYRWVLNTGVPRFVNSVYVGHIGTVIDTTDLKRSHEQMLATQKLESLGVLAAGIGHDFNNMLGAIFAESDLALTEVFPGSPVGEGLERIKGVAVRASEIVKLLFAYAGGTEISMEQVDISVLVEEMLQLLKGSFSEQVTLRTSLATNLPLIRANAGQLRQVVLNLILNALEALEHREGTLVVATARMQHSQSSAREYERERTEGEYVRLLVSDTGCGMTEEVRSKAFDPFYTTKFLGRGLGLAAVEGILRSHGGSINVRSAPGMGSTFEVLLPCIAQRSEANQPITEPVAGAPA
jgi:two-component system, cell cycle sensor histidine kinase and response regulator CckA